jgi:hypothetical protein
MLAKKHMVQGRIFLTQGKYLDVHTWQYVRVDSMKLPLFQKAVKSGVVDAAAYGDILFSGWGKNPPDEIRAKVNALYS